MAEQTVGDLGEFAVIDEVTRGLVMPPAVAVGPGDDAAVFAVPGRTVVSTDMLVEHVHFRRDWSGAHDIGRKSVGVSVADLEAMGATPVGMVVALGVPTDLPASWVKSFTEGVREEADLAGITLLGGDMVSAHDITVAVTVIGGTGEREPLTRAGANPGDVVAIVGRLGWAAAGLAALGRGFRSPRAAVDAQRRPEVPYGQGIVAAKAGATALIDVSDGLLADLGHIASASGVRIDLTSDAFDIATPVAAVAAATNTDPLAFVLGGGEDHALAGTFPAGSVPTGWTVVGRVTALGENTPGVLVDGAEPTVDAGWDQFRSR